MGGKCNLLNNLDDNPIKNTTSPSVTAPSSASTSSSGILKTNLDGRKPSNTVKFSRKNEIRLIEGGEKRKVSGNIAQQSKNLLRNINKEKESESEGYHSDCGSPHRNRKQSERKSSLERRKNYSSRNQRRNSPSRKSSDPLDPNKNNSSHLNSEVHSDSQSVVNSNSEAMSKDNIVLRIHLRSLLIRTQLLRRTLKFLRGVSRPSKTFPESGSGYYD